MRCSGDVFATVMDPDPYNVNVSGIWGHIEYPQLVTGSKYGVVDGIAAISSPKGATINSDYWRRPITKREPGNVTEVEIGKRNSCVSKDTQNDLAGVFDANGALPVFW